MVFLTNLFHQIGTTSSDLQIVLGGVTVFLDNELLCSSALADASLIMSCWWCVLELAVSGLEISEDEFWCWIIATCCSSFICCRCMATICWCMVSICFFISLIKFCCWTSWWCCLSSKDLSQKFISPALCKVIFGGDGTITSFKVATFVEIDE